MTKETTSHWIEAGYGLFALNGSGGLKVETLARKVGISKSSFYHHFADVDVFLESLFNHHLDCIHLMVQKEKACQKIDPELIDVLLEHKIDLLFNRQLRVGRQNDTYNRYVLKSNEIAGNTFVDILRSDLPFDLNQKVADGVYELAFDNFFLQITPDALNRQWLRNYFQNLIRLASQFNGIGR